MLLFWCYVNNYNQTKDEKLFNYCFCSSVNINIWNCARHHQTLCEKFIRCGYAGFYGGDFVNYADIKNRVESTDLNYYNQFDKINFRFGPGYRMGIKIDVGMKKFPLLAPTSKPYRDVYAGLLFGSGCFGTANFYENLTVKGVTTNMNNTNLHWDTLYYTHIVFVENFQEAGLSLKTLYHTNDARLFSVFAGYDICASYTLLTRMYHHVYKSKYDVVAYDDNDYHILDSDVAESFNKSHQDSYVVVKTAPSINLFTNIPMGVFMKFNKFKNWNNSLSLTLQGNIGMRFRFSYKETYMANVTGAALGLKYAFQ